MPATKPVTKAVIAAAGFGTRFLPQTKAMPKEMLPLVDKPIIQYVVEELVEAGVRDIIIITGYNKRSIEDHFDSPNSDLIANLRQGGTGKEPYIRQVEAIADLANFVYVRQKGIYGNATPIMNAQHLIGDEPFFYVFADDLFVATPSRFRQMVERYNQYGGAIFPCIKATSDQDFKRYGIMGGDSIGDGVVALRQIVEKPGREKAPSDLASVGGYLFTPDIFAYLEREQANVPEGKEFMLQPAVQAMIKDGHKFYAFMLQNSRYYDTGNKLEYLKTVVDFALKRDDLGKDFRAFLVDKLKD